MSNEFLKRSVRFLIENASVVRQYQGNTYEINFSGKSSSSIAIIETNITEVDAKDDLIANSDKLRQELLYYILENKLSDQIIETTLMTFYIYKKETIMVENDSEFSIYMPKWKNAVAVVLADDATSRSAVFKKHKDFFKENDFDVHFFKYLATRNAEK